MTYQPDETRRSIPYTRPLPSVPQQSVPPQPLPSSPLSPQPPQPLQSQQMQPAYQPVVMAPRPSSSLAVWALVLGLVGLFFGWCMLGIPCLVAVIMGHAAVAETKNDVKTGRGMAATGLALGYVALAPAIILFFWLGLGILGSVGAGSPPTTAP